MIYGLNFNNTEIPPGVKRKFRTRTRALCRCKGLQSTCLECGRGEFGVSPKGYVNAHLVGVGQSAAERDQMLIQADNGTRILHVEERRTVGGTWYGIYAW